MKSNINVAVLVYNGVELVDMNGPIDVFVHANRFGVGPFYNVYTVSAGKAPIISESGVVTIIPQYTFDTCPDPDLIVVPGKISNDARSTSVPAGPEYVAYLKKMMENSKHILSVCVGLYTVFSTGNLAGKKATTHYLSILELEEKYAKAGVTLIKNVWYYEDGNIVSTGGITSGINGALYIVSKNNGAAIAKQTADIMVYNMDAPIPPDTILPLHK